MSIPVADAGVQFPRRQQHLSGRVVFSKSRLAGVAGKDIYLNRDQRPEAGLDKWDGTLGAHPDRLQVPGVEASTGSLGHGLPMAVGVAYALRARGLREQRVFVLTGDAELNEGSNWEAPAPRGSTTSP